MKPKTILIADDDRDLLHCLATRCEIMGLHVKTATDALTALNLIHEIHPDIICMDIEMPGGNGLSACEMLATDDRVSDIPVIVLSGHADQDMVDHCNYLKATYIFKSTNYWPRLQRVLGELLEIEPLADGELDDVEPPYDETARPAATDAGLIDTVFELLGANHALLESDKKTGDSECESSAIFKDASPWVLCIEDDRDFALALKLKLEQRGIGVVRAFDGSKGITKATLRPADAILLDYHLPNGQGDYVLQQLKANPVTKDIPVIVLTGVKDQTLERKMLGLGAARFLTKPLIFEDLMSELEKHITVAMVG